MSFRVKHAGFIVAGMALPADISALLTLPAAALAHEHYRYPGWAPDYLERIAAFRAGKS
jgi:hypothetical protein